MNLKWDEKRVFRECESLRGRPIEIIDRNFPIACVEISDREKLCENPLVSVLMITYNHEHYIAKAIEGIVAQCCDFNFELIIGEDCSTDCTRDICIEYQKRYPNIIRLLISHGNVGAYLNVTRVKRSARGTLIAACEGDDYWIDAYKLQKQVDVLRDHPNVGLVFSPVKIQFGDEKSLQNSKLFFHSEGVVTRGVLRKKFLNGFMSVHTGSVLYRKINTDRYPVSDWRLTLGDLTTWLKVLDQYDAYFFVEPLSVYRVHPCSVMSTIGSRVGLDGSLVLYYFNELWGRRYARYRLILNCVEQYHKSNDISGLDKAYCSTIRELFGNTLGIRLILLFYSSVVSKIRKGSARDYLMALCTHGLFQCTISFMRNRFKLKI